MTDRSPRVTTGIGLAELTRFEVFDEVLARLPNNGPLNIGGEKSIDPPSDLENQRDLRRASLSIHESILSSSG
jgi:hypothetical protein